MKPGLGTQLRHLVELLDGAVDDAYIEAGLDYRPRYTPVMRALIDEAPLTIGEIAQRAGITQSAATQTVGLMIKEGWAVAAPGRDARQKLVRISERGQLLLPRVQACWKATAAAAASLDADLSHALSDILDEAIRVLAARSFQARIQAARVTPSRPEPDA